MGFAQIMGAGTGPSVVIRVWRARRIVQTHGYWRKLRIEWVRSCLVCVS